MEGMGLNLFCGSKTPLRPFKAYLDLGLALLGLIVTPNSPNRGYNLPPAGHHLPNPPPSHPPLYTSHS